MNSRQKSRIAHHPQLTPRELQLLKLKAQGLTLEEIAVKLTVTRHTARSHWRHVTAKLGARNDAQAINVAWERGLLGVMKASPIEKK